VPSGLVDPAQRSLEHEEGKCNQEDAIEQSHLSYALSLKFEF
jgi:hypothetical protein